MSYGEYQPGEHGTSDVLCDACDLYMIEQHCKLVCPGCGYTRDCTDP